MNRRAAVRSINGLKAMQTRCQELGYLWFDLDDCIGREFDYLHAKLQKMIDEINEVYPGRRQGGGK
jgi:hypothetical protein